MTRLFVKLGAAGLVMAFSAASHAQQALGTAFTYQGKLDLSGSPVNATADFQFSLFDAATAGTLVAGPIPVNSVSVAGGLFTATIDFGATAFNGQARWLSIAVRSPAGSGSFTTLSTRQKLTAAPYALKVPGIDGFSLDAADGSPVDALFVNNDAKVGIGTTSPATQLHVFGEVPALRIQENDDPASFLLLEDSSLGQMRLNKAGSTGTTLIDINPMSLDGTGNAHLRFFRETNTTGIKSVIFHSGNNSTATSAVIAVGGNSSVFQLDGGNFGIGTQAPFSKLHVEGGAITVSNQGDQADALWLGIERSWVFRQQGTGSFTALKLKSIGGGGNKNFLIETDGFVGIGTLNPQAKLDVNGTARAHVVEITGADLAEKFPTSDKVEPGMVVAIDRDNAGKLCLARGAYNRCVAGVVSGANDFSAGAVLGNLPGCEDAPPVALSGRVYVHCDASSAPIQPGDLLTTSDTPGHAMKATDHARAQGAIIGKAMTALESGRGTVLVLVSLQ